jgi:hypothetical protein
MTYRDRVKQITTTAGTGPITLGSASAGYRAIADAYGVGDLVPYCIESQTPGEWEVGIGTLTAPTTLARTTVTASSNAGALVNFSAGTKNVMGNASARGLSSGLTNPDDVGFDIVLCIGQSNMEGNPAWDPLIDVSDSRISQFAGSAGDAATYRKIITGSDPMYMYNGPRTGLVGPITWFGKAYLGTVPTNRRLLVVPVAVGSSAMVGNIWAVGGQMYNLAVTQANLAVTAALALYPNSRFVGCIMAQGEADANTSQTQAAYATACKAVVAGLRAAVTGASNSWFIISGMVPEKISGFPAYATIAAAHIQVAAETDRCWYVAGPTGYAADVHYTAPGIRIQGARLGLAVQSAKYFISSDVTAPVAASAAVANATPTLIQISMTEAMDTGFVPATSAFAVTGHTVSNVGISGSTITLTVDAFVNGETRTVTYTQPGANQARDLAGNLLASFASLAITNNVAAVDVTAPILTSPTGAQTGTTTATVGATTDEANGTMYAWVTTSATETAAAIKASGSTQAITTTGAKTFNITGLAASTLYYAHLVHPDAAGNDSNVVNSASFTTAASATAPATMAAPVATGGDTTASVAMVAPADGGSAITGYTVTSSPAGGTDANAGTTGLTHSITGLTNGTAYTFTATATNAIGTSAASPASNSVTPAPASVTYATWNPSDKSSNIGLSNGNLTMTRINASDAYCSARSTISVSAGKKYWENTVQVSGPWVVGIGKAAASLAAYAGFDANGWGYIQTGGKYTGGANTAYGATFVAGDVIGVALDMDAGTLTFYKNNVSQGVAYSGLTGPMFAMSTVNKASPAGAITTNFGASAFAYTPPAGFTGLSA